jgi:hypothetical protein
LALVIAFPDGHFGKQVPYSPELAGLKVPFYNAVKKSRKTDQAISFGSKLGH